MDDVPKNLREAAYVLVGFGVIGFQRAQVRRRELARRLTDLEDHLPAPARDILEVLKTGRPVPPSPPPPI